MSGLYTSSRLHVTASYFYSRLELLPALLSGLCLSVCNFSSFLSAVFLLQSIYYRSLWLSLCSVLSIRPSVCLFLPH